jgi:hypothetical protein
MIGVRIAVLLFLVFVLPLLAALAWWLKHRYTAAIVRLQAATGAREGVPAGGIGGVASDRPPAPGAPPLHVRIQPAREVALPREAAGDPDSPGRLRRRVLLFYMASDLAYWCPLILLMIFDAGGQFQFAFLRMVAPVLLPVLVIPVTVAWILQAGLPRRLLTIAAVAIAFYAFSLLWADVEGWQTGVGFSVGYAAITLMLSAFLRPAVRGAGLPLVVAGLSGWLVLIILFGIAIALEGPDEPNDSFAEIAVGSVALLTMLAISVWCGWRVLMVLSARYAAKRLSDVQIALGVYWTLLTMFVLGSLVREAEVLETGPVRTEWVVMAVVAWWLLWRFLQPLALRRVVGTADPPMGALLLLRVFKPSARSQAFTERFFAYVRFAAPVWMIAGPDLAGAYMEPDEFFAFLRRRLRDQFIADPAEVAGRVAALDCRRDPDGRCRVTEVCCTADTWQATVLEMMARASVILLDLREYSATRQGTRYELTEVLRRAPLEKVVVLVDTRVDMPRLRAEVDSIWREVGPGRPPATEPLELSVLEFRKSSQAEIQGLVRAVLGAAYTAERLRRPITSPSALGTRWL